MKTTEVNDRGLVRLIPTAYHKPPILDPLGDTAEEVEGIAGIESLTNSRLAAEKGRSAHIDKRELAFEKRATDLKVYGKSHINAAFVYTRKGGNRFNGEGRGAWYCSWDVLTSVEEVAYHKTRELSFIGDYEDESRYVELLADFIGDFPDLREGKSHSSLHPEPEIGYPAGQALALELQRKGHYGLIYPSVRCSKGTCLVAFVPSIIQNVRPGATWRLIWSGSPNYQVVNI